MTAAEKAKLLKKIKKYGIEVGLVHQAFQGLVQCEIRGIANNKALLERMIQEHTEKSEKLYSDIEKIINDL